MNKLVITGSLIVDVNKRVVGTCKRMKEVADNPSVKRGSDAHKALKVSRDRLQASISTIENDTKSRGLQARPIARKLIAGLATAYTVVDSALDGIASGDLTKAELKEATEHVTATMREFQRQWKAETIAHDAPRTKDDAEIFIEAAEREATVAAKAKKKIAKENGEEDEGADDEEDKHQYESTKLKDFYPQAEHLFNKQGAHKDKLPTSKLSKDDFVFLHLPVIPMSDSTPSADTFKEAGFQVAGSVGGIYVVLEQQFVVGINTARIKGSKNIAKEITNIVKTISKRKGEHYSIMSEEANGTNGAGRMARAGKSPGFVYFWIMPEKRLRKLSKLAERKNTSIAIQDWGLAI